MLDNTLVLAAYSSGRHTLKIFRITIQWNILATGATQSQPNSSGDWAILNIRRLHSDTLSSRNAVHRTLTHLEAISPTNHPESRLLILTAFATEKGTLLQKFEMISLPLTLHSNFDALGFRRNSISNDQKEVILLKGEHDLGKRLIGMSPLQTESIIYCTFHDGSVELRHRFVIYRKANDL